MDFLNGPGFLGTQANLFADLTLVVVLGVGALFTWGIFQVRRGQQIAHHFNQMLATLVITIIAAWLMVLPFWSHIVRREGDPMPGYSYGVTILHALTGFAAIGVGVFVVLASNNIIPNVLPLQRYKPVMRVSYWLFMAAILTGVLVYISWYVLSPGSPR